MRSIDLKEKQMLSEWAKCHAEDSFACVKDRGTYFKDRGIDDEDTYLMEYDFSTIADLKLLMEKVSKGSITSDVSQILAVAAFKKKNEKPETKQKTGCKQEETIPEFIYVF